MDFKIAIDTAGLDKELHAVLTTKMRNALQSNIEDFFINKRTLQYNPTTIRNEFITTKGDGLKQIDDMIANKFLDPKFQESMDRFFDYNWERIFEGCMTRALQHKANGIAFNKMHTLPIPKG
jgi:hypothetical protein